jgi:hypothetical protein
MYITGSWENIPDHTHQGAGQEPAKSAFDLLLLSASRVISGRATVTCVDKVLDCLCCSLFP